MLSWLQEARKEDVDALVSISSERGAFDLLRYLQKGSADKLMKALSEYDGDPLAV